MYSILLVDDESIICTAMKMIIEKSDLPVSEIRIAYNGEEALSYLRDHISQILITDIRMPHMDGLELCRNVYKKCPQISKVIISGYSDFEYAKQALKYGVNAYILKPVDKNELIQTVKEVIARMEEINTIYNIPFNVIEEISGLLESGIWLKNQGDLKEGKKRLYTVFSKLPVQYCTNILSELIKCLINRLNLKLGYSFDFRFDEFMGIEKEELSKWVEDTLHLLETELDFRRAKIEYNLIDLAQKHIEENYAKDISLTDIAALTGFATTYFSYIFKKVTGKTFIKYKTDLRIEKAKEYLIFTDKPITDIAFDIGYNNISHFIKLFKKEEGLTPSEFKEKRRRA